MAEDIAEIKATLSQLVSAVGANAQRGNDRHADIEARVAVLEHSNARLEKALWATGSVGGGALLGHIPAALAALGAG